MNSVYAILDKDSGKFFGVDNYTRAYRYSKELSSATMLWKSPDKAVENLEKRLDTFLDDGFTNPCVVEISYIVNEI